jgi:hypothetical protein
MSNDFTAVTIDCNIEAAGRNLSRSIENTLLRYRGFVAKEMF